MKSTRKQGNSLPKKTLLTVLCLFTLEATVVAHGSRIAAPLGVRFRSYNLRNILEWTPRNGTGNKTRYTVQYAIYGDGEKNKEKVVWRAKRQCRDILQTFCDLSNETSDLAEDYYGRVKAINEAGTSKWSITSRFTPKRDTTFGPPIVKVTVSERTLMIKLKGPMRWKIGNSTKEHSMAKYYPQMMYNVSIRNSNTKKTMIFLLHNNSMEYNPLNYSTEFCVSAKVHFSSLTFQSDASGERCVTTPKDPFIDRILLVVLGCILPLALTVFFLTLIGCLVYHYIFGNKQKKPSNLWVHHLPVSDVFLTMNLISISVPKASSEEEQKEADAPLEPPSPFAKEPDDEKPLLPRIPDYATQTCAPRLLPQPEDEDDVAEAEEWPARLQAWPSLSQSLDYGTVVKASSLEQVEEAWKEVDEEERKEEAEDEKEEGEGWLDGCGGGAEPSAQLPRDECARWKAYRRHFRAGHTNGHEEQQEEEEMGDTDPNGNIMLDWDPNTGRFPIPNLSMLQTEPEQVEEERPECDQVEPMNILSSVYIRQSSQDSALSEDGLTKIEKNWALQIKM